MRGVYPATSNQNMRKINDFWPDIIPSKFSLKGWQKPQQKCPLWFFFQLRFFFFFSWGCCFFSFAPPKNNFTIKIWWKKFAGTNSPTTIITHNHIKKNTSTHNENSVHPPPAPTPSPHHILKKIFVVVRPQCIQTYIIVYSITWKTLNMKGHLEVWEIYHRWWQLF